MSPVLLTATDALALTRIAALLLPAVASRPVLEMNMPPYKYCSRH
jgi:hypothetical protein